MTILPQDPAANPTPAALRAFLLQCQELARRKGRPQLVSISLEVDALDPLAVLESIFEPGERHCYVERPAERMAVAGAEAVLAFSASGPGRFAACRDFIDRALEDTLAVGDLSAPFAGPHFFAAFAFEDAVGASEPFEAASVFVPRWQVALREGRTVAVANAVVEASAPIDALAEKIWRARAKFGAFDYTGPAFAGRAGQGGGRPEPAAAADGYAAAVGAALERIGTGGLEKVVLARAKELPTGSALHPLRALNGLRQRFADCYAFSVANGRGQSFIGASPERLLRADAGLVLSEALAGSARRGTTASEDAALAAALRRDDKERREHRLVVESIAGALRELGLRPEFPAEPALRRLANVQHLHTPVRAPRPAGVRLLDVLARLHPTAAVGGAPRAAALAGIREWERFPRGLYAGALGWIDAADRGEFLVGLRSALIDGDRATLYAGAGIVAGSSPEKELAETEMKFQVMQEALLG
ncbi:MAG TPA: isochorismate synthase [Opitutaceae bacterium]|nr:isochorismate synthase [Opitutaceae bacterium]